MKTTITIAVLVILVQTTVPAPFNHLIFAAAGLLFARYFYRKGGRWGDDYQRTAWQCTNWQKQERRQAMESNCLWYRCSVIFTALFLCAAVVL